MQLFFINMHANSWEIKEYNAEEREDERNNITVKTLPDGSKVFNLLSGFVLLFKQHISEFTCI